MKKTIALILALLLCLSLCACGNTSPAEEDYDYSASEIDEEPVDEEPVDEEPVDEEPVDEEPVDEEPVDEEPVDEENPPVQDEVVDIPELSFTITAGEAGEYGALITYNQGTEFEETFYAYYVPSGTYKATNKGEYMTQINVYSDETIINEDGWEEPASTGFVKLVDVECFEIITVEEGQHIEIAEPAVFEFVQQ